MGRRSRIRWLIVRFSYQARSFLSQPSQHFVRLVSIFKFFAAFIKLSPNELLVPLLEPLLSPVYRCSSAFAPDGESNLPEVESLEQALTLDVNQRNEFLAQLAQTCMDVLSQQLQDSGQSSQFTQSLAKVRKIVDRQRSDRVRKKKLL